MKSKVFLEKFNRIEKKRKKRKKQLHELDSKHHSFLVMDFKLNSNQFLILSSYHIPGGHFEPEAKINGTNNL